MSEDRLTRCHALASTIERAHAQAVFEATPARLRPPRKSYFYDELAATCLGELLYDGGFGTKRKKVKA